LVAPASFAKGGAALIGVVGIGLLSGGHFVESTFMIASLAISPERACAVASESPAILRLKLLEAQFASLDRGRTEGDHAGQDLIAALRRAIADKPSLSFADAVAKMKTYDESARGSIGDQADETQKALLQNALADLKRLRPAAGL
jgi:hypothetical protein